MHTYTKISDTQYEVGFLTTGIWRPIRTFHLESNAAAFVNYLNGGNGQTLDLL